MRKGIEFKAGAVTLTYSAGTEEAFASTLFSDPATGNEYIAVATKDKVILWNDANNTGKYVEYTGAEVVAAADGATFCQSLEKLILFRGSGKDPLEWDGDFTDTNGDGTVDSTFDLKNNATLVRVESNVHVQTLAYSLQIDSLYHNHLTLLTRLLCPTYWTQITFLQVRANSESIVEPLTS